MKESIIIEILIYFFWKLIDGVKRKNIEDVINNYNNKIK